MKSSLTCFAVLVVSLCPLAQAEETSSTFRVMGLFSPDREKDLSEVVKQIPEVTLVSVDFKTSEATFKYDLAKAFPGTKPDKVVERFDNAIKGASRHTLGIRAVCTVPRDKLTFVEIPVVGLDCKACCLATYEAIAKIDGVEQATASYKDGLVTAWIDPTKTDREKLEAALKSRGVELKKPEEKKEEPKK